MSIKNNKGMTLVEMLVVFALIGISVMITAQVAAANARMVKRTVDQTNRIITTAKLNPAKVIAMSSACKLIEGGYYGNTNDGDTLRIYTDSQCSHLMGSINRLGNDGWFNEASSTDWLVFQSGTVLKIRLVTYSVTSS